MRIFIVWETDAAPNVAECGRTYARARDSLRDRVMRVTLMHNPGAGRGEHEADELMVLLAKAGHEATYQSTKEPDCEKVLARPADVVLAAGGDGTVGKAAQQLIGRHIPLSILPLGTANNLARTLGFQGSSIELISNLERGWRQSIDVGLAKGPWGERRFLEGAGAGLLSDYLQTLASLAEVTKHTESLSKEEEMTHHVSLLRQLLPNYPACDCQINLDGEDLSDRYILWEAMNIRSVGPVLTLAPRADAADGQFDFVAAREADRHLLADYLEGRIAAEEVEFPLPARRFRHLRLIWEGSALHFDDKIWPAKDEPVPKSGTIEIIVERGALEVLLPAVPLKRSQ
jgi:diacylglycerol kinase family enzyme